jgi:hypothetical protein
MSRLEEHEREGDKFRLALDAPGISSEHNGSDFLRRHFTLGGCDAVSRYTCDRLPFHGGIFYLRQ